MRQLPSCLATGFKHDASATGGELIKPENLLIWREVNDGAGDRENETQQMQNAFFISDADLFRINSNR